MNAVMEAQDRVTLYYREGSSDKVYQAAIEPAGELFVVNFAYGRRGSTLTTGTKTSSPVDYDTAKKIFTKLVNEKKAKGYTEGESGTPYQHTDKQSSEILPQLLNPIEEADVERLLHDDDYCAQEKFDGRHILIRRQDAQIEGINKKGLLVGLPESVSNDIRNLPGNFIPDGESVGDDYNAFDLLELNGENLRPLGYRDRLDCLKRQRHAQRRDAVARAVIFAFPNQFRPSDGERVLGLGRRPVGFCHARERNRPAGRRARAQAARLARFFGTERGTVDGFAGGL
jgi:bifunctional non-homologous end joining protein LigD